MVDSTAEYEAVTVTASSPEDLATEVQDLLNTLVRPWEVVSISHEAHVPPEPSTGRGPMVMFTALIVTARNR